MKLQSLNCAYLLSCAILLILFFCSATTAKTFSEWSTTEKMVLRLVNVQRSHHNLEWLKANSELQEAALRHCLDMASHNYLSHTSQDGRDFSERVTASGYEWTRTGENIAAGQGDAYEVMYGTSSLELLSNFDKSLGRDGFTSWDEVGENWADSEWDSWDNFRNHPAGWMGSSGHRHNILTAEYEDIGVGYALMATSDYHTYWTQDFGTGDSNIDEIPARPEMPFATDGQYSDFVFVRWQGVPGVTEYSLRRCDVQNTGECVYIYTGLGITFEDKTAAEAVQYNYVVENCNESGCSASSDWDSGYRAKKGEETLITPCIVPMLKELLL